MKSTDPSSYMTGVLTRKGEETQRHREESYAVTKAEIGVLLPQAKESQGLPAVTRICQGGMHGTDSPFKSPRRNQSSISDFWSPKL